jgi:hypothetical protein
MMMTMVAITIAGIISGTYHSSRSHGEKCVQRHKAREKAMIWQDLTSPADSGSSNHRD